MEHTVILPLSQARSEEYEASATHAKAGHTAIAGNPQEAVRTAVQPRHAR